ncbi:MAG: hypothetical protein DLM72_00025 [Candidatus Nitrosopolaris wilkensis]|nr:MAG: hypothetical protein DLM72_00025 [Candidatus Nitrosopolaris wilkensis]
MGRVLIDVGLLKSADVEIKNMNEGKVGAPFQYSDIQIHRQQQGPLPMPSICQLFMHRKLTIHNLFKCRY